MIKTLPVTAEAFKALLPEMVKEPEVAACPDLFL